MSKAISYKMQTSIFAGFCFALIFATWCTRWAVATVDGMPASYVGQPTLAWCWFVTVAGLCAAAGVVVARHWRRSGIRRVTDR